MESRERPKPVCLPERDIVSSSGLSTSKNAEAPKRGGADILINRYSLKRKKRYITPCRLPDWRETFTPAVKKINIRWEERLIRIYLFF